MNNNNNNSKVINKFWAPIKNITEAVETFCLKNNYKNILEIGPGYIPFSLATKSVGFNEKMADFIEIDIDKNLLPYENNEIDFVYCRHVLEDIQNPDFALQEIIRCSKAGYIETPSPLIEITKGIDGSPFADKYAGYIHHRYIVWSNIQKNEIYFLPKYSNIIDNFLEIDQVNVDKMLNLINTFPIYWNNYFIYDINNSPKIIMYKNGINFNTKGGAMIADYNKLICEAVNVSIQNTDYFVSNYVNK
jgi:hypothetical protein